MRKAMRSAAASMAGRSAVVGALAGGLDRASPGGLDLLGVLTYHRVSRPEERPWLHPGLISATPESFAQQMEFLASHYRIVSLDDVLDARQHRRPLGPRSVLITFDDAYVDFAEHAWPVLQQMGVPVTLFVASAYPGEPERRFWWDRMHHAFASTGRRSTLATIAGALPMADEADRRRSWATLRQHLKTVPHDVLEAEVNRLETLLEPTPCPSGAVLGWQQIKGLMAQGVTVASHSRTHPLLDRVPRRQLRDEIVGSIEDLRRATGRSPYAFAYPGGAFDDQVVESVEEAGVALAFTTRPGLNDVRQGGWLRLRRVNVGRLATPSILRLQLLPALARLDRPARGARVASARQVARSAPLHDR
jgi:peptidoglycan/xylan/chitin deacetylase (PgdA/CDA1 family)